MNEQPIPGSGSLTQREREMVARVHTMVMISPDTVVAKVLRPGSLERYLRGEVSGGAPGAAPPFDFRVTGGTVARAQDVAELRTPTDFLRAFRLDYPGSPFDPNLPVLHVLEFAAMDPAQFVVPLGAPAPPYADAGRPPNIGEVWETALRMIEAAEAVGVDPNTYRLEINPWPYTGTGITADPATGVPERWRRYAPLPAGATIFEYGADGQRRPVATYRGPLLGWGGGAPSVAWPKLGVFATVDGVEQLANSYPQNGTVTLAARDGTVTADSCDRLVEVTTLADHLGHTCQVVGVNPDGSAGLYYLGGEKAAVLRDGFTQIDGGTWAKTVATDELDRLRQRHTDLRFDEWKVRQPG